MEDLEGALLRRGELWEASDRASDLARLASSMAADLEGDYPSIEVAGDDPEQLLRQAQQALDAAREHASDILQQERAIERAEAEIHRIEQAAAARKQQLVGLVALAVVLLLIAAGVLLT